MKKGLLASILSLVGFGSFGRQSFGAVPAAGFNAALPSHVKSGSKKQCKREFKGKEKFDFVQSHGDGYGTFKSRQTGELKTMKIHKRHDFTKQHLHHYGLQTA